MLKANNLNRFNSIFKRFKSTLVIVEHNNENVTPITLNAITAAKKLSANEEITCFVIGTNCSAVADKISRISNVKRVLVAENSSFKGFLPENLAPLIAESQKKFSFSHIAIGSSAFGKSLLPRVAALLDSQPISDIIGIKDENTFIRTIYAGNAIQTLKSRENVKLFSVRGTAFEAAKLDSASSPAEVTKFDGNQAKNESSEFVGQTLTKSDRPSLTSARVVVRYLYFIIIFKKKI
jgi:electron transfer flavoprotein alpha subunit